MKQKSPKQIRNLINDELDKITKLVFSIDDVVDKLNGLIDGLEESYEDRKNSKK